MASLTSHRLRACKRREMRLRQQVCWQRIMGHRTKRRSLQWAQNRRISDLQAHVKIRKFIDNAAQPKLRCRKSFVKNYHITILPYYHQCLYTTVLYPYKYNA